MRGKAPKIISREQFMELLAAVHNICPEAEPGDKFGENYTNAALSLAEQLYDTIERATPPGAKDGILTTLRLFVEAHAANDPVAYAQQETDRGNTNTDRHDDVGAAIRLPSNVKKADWFRVVSQT